MSRYLTKRMLRRRPSHSDPIHFSLLRREKWLTWHTTEKSPCDVSPLAALSRRSIFRADDDSYRGVSASEPLLLPSGMCTPLGVVRCLPAAPTPPPPAAGALAHPAVCDGQEMVHRSRSVSLWARKKRKTDLCCPLVHPTPTNSCHCSNQKAGKSDCSLLGLQIIH